MRDKTKAGISFFFRKIIQARRWEKARMGSNSRGGRGIKDAPKIPRMKAREMYKKGEITSVCADGFLVLMSQAVQQKVAHDLNSKRDAPFIRIEIRTVERRH